MQYHRSLFVYLFFVFVTGCSSTKLPLFCIAHRGSSALHPEHTEAAYTKAIQLHADALEPDLTLTADGKLLIRHENVLGLDPVKENATSTDIATVSSLQSKAKIGLDGKRSWYAEDLTSDDLAHVAATERFLVRKKNPIEKGKLLYLQDLITLLTTSPAPTVKTLRIYPEIKTPIQVGEHNAIELLIKTLAATNMLTRERVIIQSFEDEALSQLHQKLKERGVAIPIVNLLINPEKNQRADTILTTYLTSGILQEDGIGIEKSWILECNTNTKWNCSQVRTVITKLKSQGKILHVYTIRPEQQFVTKTFSSAQEEIDTLISFNVDGIFTDDPRLCYR